MSAEPDPRDSDLAVLPTPVPRDSDLHAALATSLFAVDDRGPHLRVTTPFTLPDGDPLVLFILRHSDPPLIGDLGETLRWLRSQTVEPLRSARQQQQIVDACAGLGVALERGELRTQARPNEPLAVAVAREIQACLRVADLRRTGRPRMTRSFVDEVESYLRATLPGPLAITRNDRIAGISATTWSVDFRVRTPERHLLLFLLANERRDQARKLAEHVVAACNDLAHLRKLRRMPVQFITVFDDRGAAWNDADARLVAPFATPHRWSERASWVPALADPELSPDLEKDDPTDAEDPAESPDITEEEPVESPDIAEEEPIDAPDIAEEEPVDAPDITDEEPVADAVDTEDEGRDPEDETPIDSTDPIAHDDLPDDTTIWHDGDDASSYGDDAGSDDDGPDLHDPDGSPVAPSEAPTAARPDIREPALTIETADLDIRREEPPMNLHMRPATVADYPVFARLFPELGTGDPVPDLEAWTAHLHASTLLLAQDGEVVAYAHYERMAEFGYVRNIVVDARHRGRGRGRALMRRLAAHLRGLGCTRWCLNVEPGNRAALELYRSVGLGLAYRSAALRLDWSAVDDMPCEDVPFDTCPISDAEDAAIEAAYDLPAGQLAAIRDDPARTLLRLRDPAQPDAAGLGFASFNPHFPGAFPFRVARPGLARLLLLGLRPHALPDRPQMHVVVEDDESLRALLLAAGAELRLELLFLRGDLPTGA